MTETRCHYEVMGVERDASEEEIRKRYKRLAVQLHPDKAQQRGEDVEAANEKFREVQAAYECLTDARERAWYDSHREDILRGNAFGDESSEEEDGDEYDPQRKVARREPNLWPFFSSTTYSGYHNGTGGFYEVFRRAFAEVTAHECKECPDYLGADFGDEHSDWAEVKAFYDEFVDFQSPRQFAAYDRWKVDADTPRHVRRAADADNKKRRKAAKQLYQQMVRNLALHCRKRDPRVRDRAAAVAKERQDKEVAKQVQKARQRAEHLEARRRWLEDDQPLNDDASSYEVRTGNLLADLDFDDHPTRSSGKKKGRKKPRGKQRQVFDDDHDDDDDATAAPPGSVPAGESDPPVSGEQQDNPAAGADESQPSGAEDAAEEEEEEDLVFNCAVCKKTFKSAKQMENHLQSKAHKKKAAGKK